MGIEEAVFLRRASGLTRTISPWDALIYAWVNPGPVYAFIYIVWGPGLYPGAQMPLGVLMVLLLFPVMTVYYLFSVSMPRSGGEYIYVSRTIHPALGLFACWALTIVGISWTGQLTSWWMTWGVGDLIYNQGLLTGDAGLINLGLQFNQLDYVPGFIIGSGVLVFVFFILWRGAKTVMKTSWVCFTVSFIGLAAIVITSLTSSQEFFVQRLQELAAVDYQTQIIDSAKALGYTPGAFALAATVMAGATYINLNTLGSTYTTNVAGEIKNVTRAQPLALYGSLFLFMLYWGVFYSVEWIMPGGEFWNAISLLDNAGQDPLPVFPIASQITVYLTANPVLIHLATIGFIFGNFGGMVGLSFGPIRNLFAWAFDRILPEFVAKVDRRGSPYGAVVLAGIIAWLFYLVYSFTPFLQYILFTITLWFLGWIVVGIAGILFPFVKKDIFDKSPGVVKSRFAGVPLMTIAGVVMTAVAIFTVYFTTVPAITGLTDIINLGTTVIILGVLPFIVYYAAYFYRRRKGIRMELQYKAIPPD